MQEDNENPEVVQNNVIKRIEQGSLQFELPHSIGIDFRIDITL